jgi:cell division septation protein DedD
MKSIAANIDKESVSWTLSWQPDGRSDSFTREAILACAPPTSGVYGLFNFDCQVFIGESANIQEALLRHESETDFQSQHLRPTGFTFEPCTAELRKTKADELIARFRPVLQTGAALTETWSPSNVPMVSETDERGQELETYADHLDFPVHEREERLKVRRRFQLKRTQAVALAAMFVASAVAVFYLGMPGDYAIQKRANGAHPTSGQTEIGLRPQNASSVDTADSRANQKAQATPAKPDVRPSASTPNSAVRVAAKSASAGDDVGIQAKRGPITHSAESANLSKKWSVQISAAPAKDIADTLIRQLKAKGYDGYMVQVEVKGQTYYRVRVGHFDTREQAESVRQSLESQEGYRDAYLTGD